jgi:hypothetical protein
MKKVNKFVKRFDIFGEPISFNINKKGETHNTFFGGVLSLLYIFLFLTLFIQCSLKIKSHSADIYS